jgi:hypothetical protein
MNPEDAKLQELLRGNRPEPSLPPRFQENVWRRIEDAEAPAKPATWVEALAALILRPRLAFAAIAVLMLAGILLGAREGTETAKHEAQDRYLASVIPGSFH